jgi:hypothetical protein
VGFLIRSSINARPSPARAAKMKAKNCQLSRCSVEEFEDFFVALEGGN